jgi:hypothetical protein
MTRAYVGIDPGITGAIGVIVENPTYPSVIDVFTYTRCTDNTKQYDFYKMYKWLAGYSLRYNLEVSVEQQQAMPGQGVSSTFKTGGGYYAWLALCTIATPTFTVVSPRKWKKALGLDSDKEKSRRLAIELYPELEHMLKRKKDHNRAEALLLAHYTKLVKIG